MGLPPSEAGGLKLTVALPMAAFAVTSVGAPGTVAGVMAFEGFEAGPVPTALVAFTVNVYAVPLVSPGTIIGLPLSVTVMPPGLDVTVQLVTGTVLSSGSLKLTLA
jgi:hypothetical protein